MINDETLTLYYYDELGPTERGRVASAINNDALLAARYTALCRDLDPLRESVDVAAPAHAVHRWSESLDKAARMEDKALRRPGRPVHFLSFLLGAAVTAAVAVAIGSAVYFANDELASPAVQEQLAGQPAAASRAVPASFSRGLQDYLQQSQSDLAKLGTDADINRKALIMQIIDQNRMFERWIRWRCCWDFRASWA
jgi:anti-sigma-K factor RskA